MNADGLLTLTVSVRADHLARLDDLAARRGVERNDLLGRAIDGLLACDDLAGGYVGPRRTPSVGQVATEPVTARVRADHLARLDRMAARRDLDRTRLVGRAIDTFLAQEALIGAFGAADTAAWFAPRRDASIWASLRSAART